MQFGYYGFEETYYLKNAILQMCILKSVFRLSILKISQDTLERSNGQPKAAS